MLNKKEIKEKKKYIINRLKNNVSELEEEKLRHTLAVLMELELRNDNLKNIKLYNLIGKLSGNYTLMKDSKKISVILKPLTLKNPFITALNKDYYEFIMELAYNISKINVTYSNDEFNNINIKDKEVINISKQFYKQLDNDKICNKAIKIIDDSTHYGFTDTVSLGRDDEYGITCYDLVFTKPYISVKRTNNLMEYQAFNHEVMHGIDFYTSPIIPSQIYYGFQEVPTYTIDYLYIDYLEQKGFDKNQIDLLRRKKLAYAVSLASYIISIYQPCPIENDKCHVNWRLAKELLELESCVIAKAFYEQIKDNKEKGLNNLVKFMENPLSRDNTPEFSYVDISNDLLLYYSNNMVDNKKIVL